MTSKALTYKDSGVDIDAADEFIEKIGPFAKKTHRPEVLSSIGHYAGLFALNQKKYKNPVLVSSTDGVGTKVKLALEWDLLEGLGQDLVAMSANDIICLGAEPLFFLDYFATGKLQVSQACRIIKGIAQACRDIHCALLGGETAEMPTIYQGADFDLAGFIVGVVEKNKVIDGSQVKVGDKIIGIASSGVHSNGFSLVRKIIDAQNLSPDKTYPGLKKSLRETLIEPTRLYIKTILKLKQSFSLHGIAHITGGGLIENLPRVFPKNCRALLRSDAWPRPLLFQWIQKWGRIPESEMYRVFNCGIGLTLIVKSKDSPLILKKLRSLGEEAWEIGEIAEKKKKESVEIL